MEALLCLIYDEVINYLRNNVGIYLFIVNLFVAGIILGAFGIRFLDKVQVAELNQFFSYFLHSVNETPLSQGVILKQSLQNSLRYVGLICFFGLFAAGFLVIIAIVIFKGITIGFAVGFLVERSAIRGMLFCIGTILPHNLFIIPAFIAVAATGFSFSLRRFKSYLQKRSKPLKDNLGKYMLLNAVMVLILLIGAIVEAYITPVFMRLLIPLL